MPVDRRATAGACDIRERDRLQGAGARVPGGVGAGAHPRRGRRARLLHERVPLAAAGAAPVPLGALVPAGGAAEDGGGAGHLSRLSGRADDFAPAQGFAIRPGRAVASVVRGFARPTRGGRRVRRRRHRDQRARLRPLRADRGRGRAGRWRRAARHIRLAGADGTAALRAGSSASPASRRRWSTPRRRPRGAGGAGRAARGAGAGRPLRPLRHPRAAPGLRALRPRLAQAARDLHGRAGAPVRAARAQARAGVAGRLARHRGGRGAPRPARRPDVRARLLRAVPPYLRERADRGGRARPVAQPPAGTQDRARRAHPAVRAPGPLDAAGRPGRVHLPRRARATAVRGQVGVAALARPRALLRAGGLDGEGRDRRLPAHELGAGRTRAREPA